MIYSIAAARHQSTVSHIHNTRCRRKGVETSVTCERNTVVNGQCQAAAPAKTAPYLTNRELALPHIKYTHLSRAVAVSRWLALALPCAPRTQGSVGVRSDTSPKNGGHGHTSPSPIHRLRRPQTYLLPRCPQPHLFGSNMSSDDDEAKIEKLDKFLAKLVKN